MCVAPLTIVNPRYKGNHERENLGFCALGRIGALPYMDYTIEVPCGKCPECLSRRREEFSFRVIYEMERSYSPVFITLTYSDEFLPAGANLSKDDAKRFLKYCRNHLPFRFRYYLCGEYGEDHGRPHYHVCMMPSEDVGYFDWNSFLSKAWFPCITDVLPLNPARCAYCCKYSIKQLGMCYGGRVPPFHLFSKSLGSGFVSEFGSKIQQNGEPIFDGKPLSRYYSQKLFSDSFLRIYNARKAAEYKDKLFELHGKRVFRVIRNSQLNDLVNVYVKEQKKVLR